MPVLKRLAACFLRSDICKRQLACFTLSVCLHAAGAWFLGRSLVTPDERVEVVVFEIKGDSQEVSVRKEILRKPRAKVRAAEPVVADAPATSELTNEKATQSPSESESFGTADGLEVSAQERYRIELQAMLEKRKQYPLLAKRLRQQGKVLVRFTLRRDGTVAAAEVVENSEFETLNKAARELITQISGLKPFPDDVKKTQWVFVLPVEYRM